MDLNEKRSIEVKEREKAENLLKKSNDQLEARVAERTKQLEDAQFSIVETEKFNTFGRMAAGVAHEVKNPLAIIQFGTEYLSRKVPKDNEVIKGTVDDIFRAIERANLIISDLLSYSAPRPMEFKEESVNSILQEALHLVVHEALEKNITVKTSFEASLPKLDLDKQKILQVFVNLITNAVHATPSSGHIEVRTRQERAEDLLGESFDHGEGLVVFCEVVDSGSGIPEEEVKKVFEPFYTTKDIGTGLGLSVSNHIIDLHGGSLVLENLPEGGACARVTFMV
jgi:signal transduction histidine kinase